MMQRRNKMRTIGMGLAAVLMGALLPAGAHAEELLFRNETNGPIIIQAACVVRGVLRRDRPYLLKPGDATPAIVLPGNKLITIYDGLNTNRVIFQGTIPGGLGNQAFGVGIDPTGGVMVSPKAMPPGP
ncbi:MAG TPA: hypothetical protein VMS17_27555 [Gemmataceae bacterium]|nr:hypothetical protein [Gemmataceae bacterium]